MMLTAAVPCCIKSHQDAYRLHSEWLIQIGSYLPGKARVGRQHDHAEWWYMHENMRR